MPKANRTDDARAATRAKVKSHREKLRAQGLRPIQIWVPDTRAPGFAEEVRRQCQLIANSPQEADDQAFIDSVSWLNPDEAR
jgi:hypothetical protein